MVDIQRMLEKNRGEKRIFNTYQEPDLVEVIFRDENGHLKSVEGKEFCDCGDLIMVTRLDASPDEVSQLHTTYINKRNVLIVRREQLI